MTMISIGRAVCTISYLFLFFFVCLFRCHKLVNAPIVLLQQDEDTENMSACEVVVQNCNYMFMNDYNIDRLRDLHILLLVFSMSSCR